jgi:hypothetical protein
VGEVGDPGTIVTLSYYGYNGACFTAGSLRPGQSYWVKASSAETFVLEK